MDETMSLNARLERIKKGQTASPEAAAKKFLYWSRLPAEKFFHSKDDVDLLWEKCGLIAYEGRPGIEIDHYYSFCWFFMHMFRDMQINHRESFLDTEDDVNFVNAMIFLAEMIIDTLKDKKCDLRIKAAFNMTMGDFWGAVFDVNVDNNGKWNVHRQNHIRKDHEFFCQVHKDDETIKHTLGNILNDYMEMWRYIAWLDHIIETDKEISNHCDIDKADNFEPPVKDFNDENVKGVRKKILLPGKCYSKEAIEEMRGRIKNPECLEAFDDLIASQAFEQAVKSSKILAKHLYHILIMPFIGIERYHYEVHQKM